MQIFIIQYMVVGRGSNQKNLFRAVFMSTETVHLLNRAFKKTSKKVDKKSLYIENKKPHIPSAGNVLRLTSRDMITKFKCVPSYMVTNCFYIV